MIEEGRKKKKEDNALRSYPQQFHLDKKNQFQGRNNEKEVGKQIEKKSKTK